MMNGFITKRLSVIAWTPGFVQFHYRHDGPLDEVLAAGFFGTGDEWFAHQNHVTITAADGSAEVLCDCRQPERMALVPIYRADLPLAVTA